MDLRGGNVSDQGVFVRSQPLEVFERVPVSAGETLKAAIYNTTTVRVIFFMNLV